MEENKTAVEWLIEQIKEDLNLRLRGFDIDGIGKQAKEMEKKQLEDVRRDGYLDYDEELRKTFKKTENNDKK